MKSNCIFCKIVEKKIPSTVCWSNENFIAFYDIHPKAPVHVLVIPKHHVDQLSALGRDDRSWLGEFMLAITEAATSLHLDHYKVLFNNGHDSGQEVFHLHAHLLQY
jgi:histidine triad (HIT) family protein